LSLLALAGLWAGAQNALAGGGSFVTLPALIATGLDARVANLTSTVALSPGQITTALANRRLMGPVAGVGVAALLAISMAGGALGAWLLLLTPSRLFEAMLPWLVLVATLLFARGAFGPPLRSGALPRPAVLAGQTASALYGGYFGGGNGFVMLALYSFAGTVVKVAQANKNACAAAMNLAGAGVFLASGETAALPALAVGAGAILGGWLGARAIHHVPDKALKASVVAIGLMLFAGLILRQA
jgi:hypothetical protein